MSTDGVSVGRSLLQAALTYSHYAGYCMLYLFILKGFQIGRGRGVKDTVHLDVMKGPVVYFYVSCREIALGDMF